MSISEVTLFAIVTVLLSACANPLNQVTSTRYAQECTQAEQAGDLVAAEQACDRALVNVDWGNLGEEQKSQRLYNLARIKRRLAKFKEAETLLKNSLEIEGRLGKADEVKVGRRLVELSVNLAAQDKWDEGATTLTRVIEIVPAFTGSERQYAKEVISNYSKHFDSVGNSEKAAAFTKAAEGF